MPESNFGALGERLLRAGIAPVHARRLVAELEAHYALLVEEELARGESLAAARSAARIHLGSDDDIAAKAREQAVLMSWGARWPLVVCGLAPTLASLAASAALVAALAIAFHLSGPRGDPGLWARNATRLIGWSVMYALPLVWAWVLMRYSITRRLGWRWPAIGLLGTAASGALTNFSVTWPGPGVHGGLSAGVGWISDGVASFAIRCLVTVVLGLTMSLLLRGHIERRAIA